MELNIPFALYAFPGDENFTFIASYPDEELFNAAYAEPPGAKSFFISPFCAPIKDSFLIRDRLSPSDILAIPSSAKPFPGADITPQYTSTPFPYYYAKVREAREDIKKGKFDKVVLSRCIHQPTEHHPIDIAESYFASLPSTFRAIFFTQETGLWVSATPELLMETVEDKAEGDYIRAMSLAGTRPCSSSGQWDSKNLAEHETVLDYIISILTEMGMDCNVSDSSVMPFGFVEHRMHIIEAHARDKEVNCYEVIERLSPTPALAGMPLEPAVRFISRSELHNRHCYGGLIGVIGDNGIKLFVNIRCALFGPETHCFGEHFRDVNIFAGGGIMAQSSAIREWEEAGEKAAPLYLCLDCQNEPTELTYVPDHWVDLKS